MLMVLWLWMWGDWKILGLKSLIIVRVLARGRDRGPGSVMPRWWMIDERLGVAQVGYSRDSD